MQEEQYYIYIMTNRYNEVLYTGMTFDLAKRMWEHKQKLVKGFTHKYRINKLVYYECAPDKFSALAREKQIKAGSRAKKITLVESINPEWYDLSKDLV